METFKKSHVPKSNGGRTQLEICKNPNLPSTQMSRRNAVTDFDHIITTSTDAGTLPPTQ